MPRQFVEKWVLNGRDDSVNKEVDTIRSGFPSLAESGYYHWADSQVYTHLLSVPSGKRFRLQRMIVHNDKVPNKVVFYDGPGVSVTAFIIDMAQSQTEFISDIDVPFQSHMCASNLDSYIFVRVQGILITSG